MPAEHDYPPPAKTDMERREHKRYQSAHAFEQNLPPVPRSSVHACATCDHDAEIVGRLKPRVEHFHQGLSEHEQYQTQLQQRQTRNYMRYQRGLRT